MLTLQFYTRKECTLCHSALTAVKRVQNRIPFQLDLIDIDSDPMLQQRYGTMIPVVTCGDIELASGFIDEKNLLAAVKNLPS